jgi:hypothetical protein
MSKTDSTIYRNALSELLRLVERDISRQCVHDCSCNDRPRDERPCDDCSTGERRYLVDKVRKGMHELF